MPNTSAFAERFDQPESARTRKRTTLVAHQAAKFAHEPLHAKSITCPACARDAIDQFFRGHQRHPATSASTSRHAIRVPPSPLTCAAGPAGSSPGEHEAAIQFPRPRRAGALKHRSHLTVRVLDGWLYDLLDDDARGDCRNRPLRYPG